MAEVSEELIQPEELGKYEVMVETLVYGGDNDIPEQRIAKRGDIIEVPTDWAKARGTSLRELPPPDKNLKLDEQLGRTIKDVDSLKAQLDTQAQIIQNLMEERDMLNGKMEMLKNEREEAVRLYNQLLKKRTREYNKEKLGMKIAEAGSK